MFFCHAVIAFAAPGIFKIRVVMDDNYPPYSFRNNEGEVQGILIDQWALWSKKTGVQVDLAAMDWNTALREMERRKFDVIDTIFESEAREQYLDFTAPYVDIDVPIFFRNTISGITDAQSLVGFVVGVKSGDACIDFLRERGIETLVEYESYEKLVLAAKEGEVVTFVADESPVLYLLYKHNIGADFNYTQALFTGQLHRGVLKGNSELLALVEDGFGKISENEYKMIQEKWFGKSSATLGNVLKYATVIGSVIAGITVFLLAWNRSLKKTVRAKTYEIVQAVRKTEQSNRKLNAIIKAIPDLVFITNKEGIFLDFLSADRHKDLYKPKEDFLGKSMKQVLPPEIVGKYMKAIERVISGKGSQEVKYSLNMEKGQHYYEARLVPVDEERILCIARDISEEKKAQEKIYEMSIRDSVTGLFNRTFFEKETEKLGDPKTGGTGIIMCDIDGLKLINDTMGHAAGDRYLYAVGQVLSSAIKKRGFVSRIGGDEFAVVIANASLKEIVEFVDLILGELETINAKNEHEIPISISIGYSLADGDKKDIREALIEADDLMYRDKLHHRQSVRSYSIDLLRKMLAERDFITEGHGDRMQENIRKMAIALDFSPDSINDLLLFAQFHDIGKVGVPDTLLYKKSHLSDSEREEMKRHSEIGFRIAESSPDLRHISDWILKHHEWWDGTGYPLGLKGISIPLECRMLSVIDAFDAMTNDRPYQKARPYEEAFKELRKFAGLQFDPALIELFIDIINKDDE